MKEQKLYTINEVAEMLHYHRRSLYRLISEGKLESIKVGKRYITEEQLQKFLSGKNYKEEEK